MVLSAGHGSFVLLDINSKHPTNDARQRGPACYLCSLQVAKLSKELIPKVRPAYYFRNLKGTRGGCIFHVFGEPYQVYARLSYDPADLVLVWEGDRMPTLKEVQMEILPNARSIEGNKAQAGGTDEA